MSLVATDPEVFVKPPGVTKYREFDFTAELPSGDSLSPPPTLNVTPSGTLTVTYSSTTGPKVKCKFQNGTAGTVYHATCQIDTSGSETLIRGMVIDVRDP